MTFGAIILNYWVLGPCGAYTGPRPRAPLIMACTPELNSYAPPSPSRKRIRNQRELCEFLDRPILGGSRVEGWQPMSLRSQAKPPGPGHSRLAAAQAAEAAKRCDDSGGGLRLHPKSNGSSVGVRYFIVTLSQKLDIPKIELHESLWVVLVSSRTRRIGGA